MYSPNESTTAVRPVGIDIEVADETLSFRSVRIDDLTPTGDQLARVAGGKPPDSAVVLQMLADGALETVRPDETVDLSQADGRFIIVQSDRLYLFSIEGERFEWPCRAVSGGLVRKLGAIDTDKAVYLQRINEPDRIIGDHDLVDLDAPGIEAFIARRAHWKLNVHGVVIDVATPKISVRAAIEQAGFDPDKDWHIFFKVAGEKKREVELDTILDLETPGIEKLRLLPKNVDNGEALAALRRDFDLLDEDTTYLEQLGLIWETLVEVDGRRWLLLHNYPVPPGYTVTATLLALEVPPAYPGAQIYGFYVYPPLALVSGSEIASTQMRGVIREKEFHGWSRNRGQGASWNGEKDNVVTQLALVEAALAKEVGE